MTTIGGGESAAYGLKYQYLATLDYYLRFLREQPELIASSTLVVEPLLIKPDGDDDDIVDFSIEIADLPAQHVQVKATTSPADYPLQPAKARETLNRLLSHAAIHSIVLTNKPLSPELAKDCTAADPSRQPTAYRWTTGPQPSGDAKAQPLIAVDTRSPAEIRASIVDSVRHFRGHCALGPGLTSARMLVSILLDFIFDAAAGNEPNRISALDLLARIHMPDADMAHLAGGFDWGLPMTGIPSYASTFPRMSILDEVTEHLSVGDTSAVPARVVLAGQTGIGKSVIAHRLLPY